MTHLSNASGAHGIDQMPCDKVKVPLIEALFRYKLLMRSGHALAAILGWPTKGKCEELHLHKQSNCSVLACWPAILYNGRGKEASTPNTGV